MSLLTFTDRQLIVLIAQGDEAAFTAMYNRYYLTLTRSGFKRLQNESVVEELVQDVFVNLWNRAAELDPDGNIKSYLFATLRNKVLHELRASMVIARHARIICQQQNYLAEDTDSLMHTRHLEEKFESIVKELPPQCREAFTLSRFEELSYKSIAERMNISVNTVEKHIGKALNILRRAFKEYDITLLLLLSIALVR
ncbi:MAG TPA: RNA polymerase sigma-70 factor [Pedobacter sp.]|jgi:RNA polymerase sigma-70 factor (ECF subfamily)